jgi:hypothetical protein
MNTRPQGVRRMGVTQVVKANGPNSGQPNAPLEVVAEEGGMDRAIVVAVKDQAVVVELPASNFRGFAMQAEKLSCLGVKRDRSAAPFGLGRSEVKRVPDPYQRLHNTEFVRL